MSAEQALGRVPWAAAVVFLVVSFGAAWLVVLPLWLSGGLANPLMMPLGFAMMATPTLGALVATLFVLRPKHPARFLGLARSRSWRQTLGYAAIGFFGLQVIGVLAILVGWAVGGTPIRITPDAWIPLLSMQLLGLLTALPALWEEIGWRGFLLPALRPLGTWPALLVSGLVWGPWHAPLLLLGDNYGIANPISIVLMTVTTVLLGVLFGWLRMRTGSVYPAALAHGALNATTGTLLMVLAPDSTSVLPSVLGWGGWLVVLVIIAGLVVAKGFSWAPAQRSVSAESTSDVFQHRFTDQDRKDEKQRQILIG